MMDEGTGPPVIVIPGIQGRWEWMMPALRELRRSCRAISYSLCGDRGSGVDRDPALGFENYMRQLDAVFEKTGVSRAALCGVSLRGLHRVPLCGDAARTRQRARPRFSALTRLAAVRAPTTVSGEPPPPRAALHADGARPLVGRNPFGHTILEGPHVFRRDLRCAGPDRAARSCSCGSPYCRSAGGRLHGRRGTRESADSGCHRGRFARPCGAPGRVPGVSFTDTWRQLFEARWNRTYRHDHPALALRAHRQRFRPCQQSLTSPARWVASKRCSISRLLLPTPRSRRSMPLSCSPIRIRNLAGRCIRR